MAGGPCRNVDGTKGHHRPQPPPQPLPPVGREISPVEIERGLLYFIRHASRLVPRHQFALNLLHIMWM